MKVILFGATGMVGQGVLRECLLDPEIERVVAVGRTASGVRDGKLREIVHANLGNLASIETQLAGCDACFFCLGVSSAGMEEEDYTRVTYGFAIAAAETLCRLNPAMTFIYVSGQGADSSEKGRTMWARVKGRTENALLRLPFRAVYMFRPGAIQPMHGARSKTASYRYLYAVLGPLLPLLRALFPNQILTTEQIGRAMLAAVRRGYSKKVLESADIRALAVN
jgi:uncharacterized protein YbjT (DUF2867 family)